MFGKGEGLVAGLRFLLKNTSTAKMGESPIGRAGGGHAPRATCRKRHAAFST